MKISMTESRTVGAFGLLEAGKSYSHLPKDVCQQLINNGVAVESVPKTAKSKSETKEG